MKDDRTPPRPVRTSKPRPVAMPEAAREMVRKRSQERTDPKGRPRAAGRAHDHADNPTAKSPERVTAEEAPNRASGKAASRTLEIDGVRWTVRVVGGQVVGHGALARTPLTCLRFERAHRQDEGTRRKDEGARSEKGSDSRELLAPIGSIETLFDEELMELFRSAPTVTHREAEG